MTAKTEPVCPRGRPISSPDTYPCGCPRTPENSSKREGCGSVCLACKRTKQRAYYAAHREYFRAYRAAHREQFRVYMRAWRADEPTPRIGDG